MQYARKLCSAAAALGLASLGGRAEASAVIDIKQHGHNLDATGSGAIDLNGLTFFASALALAGATPSVGNITIGAEPDDKQDVYSGVSGPASFGSGSRTAALDGSGDRFGADAADSFLFVPHGYVSGTALSGFATFEGQTFATLGVTPGTYVYSWGSGDHTDTLTLEIGGEVPEPSTWAMMLLGFAGLGFASSRASRRTAAVGFRA